MTKRTPPYRHSDSSNCWTKNCSRGNTTAEVHAARENETDLRKKISSLPESYTGPTFIDAIAPIETFERAAKNIEVTRQRHPEYPFSIFKYSQSTTYSKNWNDVTMASRGLIINDETNEILARPFSKFFNYSEDKTPLELMTGPMSITEKLDGSLGISYPTPDGLQISTAGGFQSPQAAHATALYREKYEGNWKPRKGVTYLWEIIYPENRIVVNYGDEDDIHLLGAVNIRTGNSIPLSEIKEWKWKRAAEYPSMKTLDEVAGSPERSNHEGYIVHFTETNTRVKFKHAEYLLHHRFATNINSRRIWEMLREDEDMSSWVQNAPEEFEDYITKTRDGIQKSFDDEVERINSTYKTFAASLPADISPKDYAAAVNSRVPQLDKGFFFSLKNNGVMGNDRTIRSLWDRVKPDFEKSFWSANNGGTKEEE